ncbi:glycoside hydrolase family 20 zincin-like fold domain-containing protein, partial [Paenibacillus planticolens]
MKFKTKGTIKLALLFIFAFVVYMLPGIVASAAGSQSSNPNLALGKSVTYSGVEGGMSGGNWKYPQFVGGKAVDGDPSTRWSADKVDYQWLIVDLGEGKEVSKIVINFHVTSPDYAVFVSKDGKTYESVYQVTNGPSGVSVSKEIEFSRQPVRYIKYEQYKQWKHTNNQYYGSSIYELEAYEHANDTAAKVLKEAESGPLKLSEDGRRLLLPQVSEDYIIRLYGSDTKEVIALDGTVTKPLVDMGVNLLYKVENKHDPSDVATSQQDIRFVVPGQYTREAGDNSVPDVLPGLREWKGHTGNFVLTESSRIVTLDDSLNEMARTIQFYFKNMLHRDIPIGSGEAQPGDIVLKLAAGQSILGEEGYTLDIRDMIVISASKAKGILYGGISITQMLYQDKNHVHVPKGLARDYPKYGVRSGMIDVGRMYIPLEYLQEMTMYMAWFKLNEVQVHVNDYWGNSGYSAFRLESTKYPQ